MVTWYSSGMETTKRRIVAVSGGFDPIHIGHVSMLQEARALGDKLVVILNNNDWLIAKKGFAFMPQEERAELLAAYDFVDEVVLTCHTLEELTHEENWAYHRSVSRELAKIKPHIFANGGDRDENDSKNPKSSLYWDIKTCEDHGIDMVFGIGHGGKVQSSSWLIAKAKEAQQVK